MSMNYFTAAAAATSAADDGDVSSSSSSCSSSSASEIEFDEGTTEEEAMAFWERRCDQRAERKEQERQRLERERQGIFDPPPKPVDLTENMMGEYDPRYHDAWMACERFANLYRQPGLRENYVASTPGLANMIEERKQKEAKKKHKKEIKRRQREGEANQHLQLLYAEQERISRGGQVPSPTTIGGLLQGVATTDTNASTSSYAAALAAQAREYERIRQNVQDERARSESRQGQGNDFAKTGSKMMKPITERYFLGTSYQTQTNSKAVSCQNCCASLFTNPLAVRFFCQNCAIVSPCQDDVMDTRWEEKMQEAEDMEC